MVMLIVLAHASLLLLAPVNFEHSFADAAEFFVARDPSLLQEYFSVQANTVGMPFLTAAVSRLLPGIPLLQVMRGIVLLGIPMLAAAVHRLCAVLERDDAHLVTLYVLLNPLVWIYAGRATADFLPMAIGIWAITLTLQSTISLRRAIAGGLLLGLAAVLKYHAAFLALAAAAYHLRGAPRTWPWRQIGAFLFSLSMPLGAYLLCAHAAFGFWLTPPEFQMKHQFSVTGFASNLFCYAGYLVLLAMPTLPLLADVRHAVARSWRSVLLVLCAMCFVGAFFIVDNGEMNLGPADRWIPANLRTALFGILAAGLVLPLWLTPRRVQHHAKALLYAIIAIVVVFSLTRPAQRYLLFVVPLFVALLPAQLFSNRRIFVATLSLFLVANVFVEYSRACTGTAAARMAEKVIELDLAAKTDLGAIQGHVGLYIGHTPPVDIEYTVVKGAAPGAVATTQAGLPLLPSIYSLVRVTPVEIYGR